MASLYYIVFGLGVLFNIFQRNNNKHIKICLYSYALSDCYMYYFLIVICICDHPLASSGQHFFFFFNGMCSI